jgi:hypothetical protein
VKRSIEFDLVTKIEANARFASKAGMFAKSKRTALQRAAVKAVLASHFGALVPPRYIEQGAALVQNKVSVRLTRIAPGHTADAWENLRGALKAVKDQVAAWCGCDDKEGAGITWLDPGQEKQGPAVYRVRLEIEDLSPGAPRRVVLAETSSTGRLAASEVKRKIKKAKDMQDIKRNGRVLSYSPEAAARGASSAARGRADAMFAKLTAANGRGPNVLPDGPTLLDLRDAAERLIGERVAVSRGPGVGSIGARHIDPGEERPARELAACTTCGAIVPEPCDEKVPGRMIHGVHVARARVAGHVAAGKLPDVYKAPTNGVRKVATVPGQARLVARRVFVALPWEQPPCGVCGGSGTLSTSHGRGVRDPCGACSTSPDSIAGRGYKLTKLMPERRLEDVAINRPTVAYAVPLAHRATWGHEVTLHRREATLPTIGVCWVYEIAR